MLLLEDVVRYCIIPFLEAEDIYNLTLAGIPVMAELISRLQEMNIDRLYNLRELGGPFSLVFTRRLTELDDASRTRLAIVHDDPDLLPSSNEKPILELALLYPSLRVATTLAEKLGIEALAESGIGTKGYRVVTMSEKLLSQLRDSRSIAGFLEEALYDRGVDGMLELSLALGSIPESCLLDLRDCMGDDEFEIWCEGLAGNPIYGYSEFLDSLLHYLDRLRRAKIPIY
jgi:hypothetical protein